MGKLFLASSINNVTPMISRELKGGQKGKKVLFITTASEVEEGNKQWLEEDKKALKNIGLETIDYTITGKSKNDFVKDFKDIHYVFVSGGNTFYLLEKAQQSGFINFINGYMQKENVYFGSSAGAAIAGPDIYPLFKVDSPEKAPNLKGYKGFGLIDLVILPHWGSEDFKELYLNHRLEQAYGDKCKLILLTDYQYISVENDGSYKILDVK
jgi:dipeptidase E